MCGSGVVQTQSQRTLELRKIFALFRVLSIVVNSLHNPWLCAPLVPPCPPRRPGDTVWAARWPESVPSACTHTHSLSLARSLARAACASGPPRGRGGEDSLLSSACPATGRAWCSILHAFALRSFFFSPSRILSTTLCTRPKSWARAVVVSAKRVEHQARRAVLSPSRESGRLPGAWPRRKASSSPCAPHAAAEHACVACRHPCLE